MCVCALARYTCSSTSAFLPEATKALLVIDPCKAKVGKRTGECCSTVRADRKEQKHYYTNTADSAANSNISPEQLGCFGEQAKGKRDKRT